MWHTIGMVDLTDYIPPDSEDNGSSQSGGISFSASLSDPSTTWDFVIDDIHQSLNVQNFLPVIVWDENAPPTYTIGGTPVPTIPAMNFLVNPVLQINGGQTAVNSWNVTGTLPGATWDYTHQFNPKLTVANNTNGQFSLQNQTTQLGYVIAGQQYMLSVYMTGSGTISNFQSLLELFFFDVNGNTLTPTTIDQRTPLLGQNRISISVVAPAGAVSAGVAFGGITTGATNSGTITFGTAQFEPMWFVNKGVSYPTPDCNQAQVNSVLMPDGTTSRKCRLFAGYIEDTVAAYVGRQRHYAVQCASSSKLLDTAGFVSFSVTNTQDTSIITTAIGLLPTNANIIGQFATGQQNNFSPVSTLIAGTLIDSMSFNNSTLKEVLNAVKGQSGSYYFVDPYYYIWYVPPSFVGTVVALSDNPDNINSFPYHDFTIERDSTNPVNVAMVKGSKQHATITETFSGNGSTTVFNLQEPPATTHQVTVGGVNQRTGVDGIDNSKFGPSLTYKALINKQNATITFATAPASGTNNVVVGYTYEDEVLSQVIGADALANQRAQFWSLVSDSTITSTKAAKNRGLKELTDYAFPRTILTLSSLNIYLPVGSLILFTNQSEGFTNQPFVVQTVDSDMQGGGVYRWNYTAGVYNPTLMDHIKNVHKAIKKTPTTANVVVIASTDVAIFDSFVLNDSIVVNNLFVPSNGPYAYGGYNEYVKQDLTAGSAYYRMDASSGTSETDISGGGFIGTYAGGFTLNQAGALTGDPDKAVLFNGSTGKMTCSAGLNAAGWTSLTLECWFNLSNTSFGSAARLISNDHTSSDKNGCELIVGAGGNGLIFAAGNGTTLVNFTGNMSFAANTWYHVVATWVSGGSAILYVNGSVLGSTSAPSGAIGTPTNAFGIGFAPATNSNFFPGLIDEVAIIKNSALSSGRITTHYNEGANPANRYGFCSYA